MAIQFKCMQLLLPEKLSKQNKSSFYGNGKLVVEAGQH